MRFWLHIICAFKRQDVPSGLEVILGYVTSPAVILTPIDMHHSWGSFCSVSIMTRTHHCQWSHCWFENIVYVTPVTNPTMRHVILNWYFYSSFTNEQNHTAISTADVVLYFHLNFHIFPVSSPAMFEQKKHPVAPRHGTPDDGFAAPGSPQCCFRHRCQRHIGRADGGLAGAENLKTEGPSGCWVCFWLNVYTAEILT